MRLDHFFSVPTSKQILDALMDAIRATNSSGFHCGQCPSDVEKRIAKINECFEEFSDPTNVFIRELKRKLGNYVKVDVDDRTIMGRAVVEDGRVVSLEEAYGYSHEVEVFVDSRPVALVYIDEIAECNDDELRIKVEAYIDDIYDDEIKKLFCTKYSDSALCEDAQAIHITEGEGF